MRRLIFLALLSAAPLLVMDAKPTSACDWGYGYGYGAYLWRDNLDENGASIRMRRGGRVSP